MSGKVESIGTSQAGNEKFALILDEIQATRKDKEGKDQFRLFGKHRIDGKNYQLNGTLTEIVRG